MRPRRLIVLIHSDQEKASMLKMVLSVRSLYEVVVAEGGEEAAAFAYDADARLIVTGRSFEGYLPRFRQVAPGVPILMVGGRVGSAAPSTADAVVFWGEGFAMRFVEQVKLLSERKRGPRGFAPGMAAGSNGSGATTTKLSPSAKYVINRLVRSRKDRRLSQTVLGRCIGVHRNTLCAWENLAREPSLSEFLLWQDALDGVPITLRVHGAA